MQNTNYTEALVALQKRFESLNRALSVMDNAYLVERFLVELVQNQRSLSVKVNQYEIELKNVINERRDQKAAELKSIIKLANTESELLSQLIDSARVKEATLRQNAASQADAAPAPSSAASVPSSGSSRTVTNEAIIRQNAASQADAAPTPSSTASVEPSAGSPGVSSLSGSDALRVAALLRRGLEVGGSRKGSTPQPSTPPPLPPSNSAGAPSSLSSTSNAATQSATKLSSVSSAPAQPTPGTHKPRAGSMPNRAGSESNIVIGRKATASEGVSQAAGSPPPSPLASSVSTIPPKPAVLRTPQRPHVSLEPPGVAAVVPPSVVVTQAPVNDMPSRGSTSGSISSSNASTVSVPSSPLAQTAKRTVAGGADARPLRPVLPTIQAVKKMEKISEIVQQVAAKKMTAEKAAEETAIVMIQMDHAMHENLMRERERRFPTNKQQNESSVIPTTLTSTKSSTESQDHHQPMVPKDERILQLEKTELAKYLNAYEIIRFYLESPVQQKADIDNLQKVIRKSIVSCDPLMNEINEISLRIDEIERLEKIETADNWEKRQKQRKLEYRIKDTRDENIKDNLQAELAQLLKDDEKEYQDKLPVITALQQEKADLIKKLTGKEKELTERSKAFNSGELESKELKEIINTKKRMVEMWLKVADILHRNHDYEGLFQVQSVLNKLYRTASKDFELDELSVNQLAQYSRLAVDNTYAKDVMREHITNNQHFIPLLAIVAPSLTTGKELFDPLIDLIKPLPNPEAISRRAEEIEKLGRETREGWKKKLEDKQTTAADRTRILEKLEKSDSEIGKEVLKIKLEKSHIPVSKVITDTDSLESHLPTSVEIKPKSLFSGARTVDLRSDAEEAASVRMVDESIDKVDSKIEATRTTCESLVEEISKLSTNTDKTTFIEKNKQLFEAYKKLAQFEQDKRKLLKADDYDGQKVCLDYEQTYLSKAIQLAKGLIELDKKNKTHWTTQQSDLNYQHDKSHQFLKLILDTRSSKVYSENILSVTNQNQLDLDKSELTKTAKNLLAKFGEQRNTREDNFIYSSYLSNNLSRISALWDKIKPPEQDVQHPPRVMSDLEIYQATLKIAIKVLSLQIKLDDVKNAGKELKSFAEITKFQTELAEVSTDAKKAIDDIEKLGAKADPSTNDMRSMLRKISAASHIEHVPKPPHPQLDATAHPSLDSH